MGKYSEIPEFDKDDGNRIPTFDRWKKKHAFRVSNNQFVYDSKIYTSDELVELYKELYYGEG